MALATDTRATLLRTLAPIAGEEAIMDMLSQFPTDDDDRPITVRHLDAQLTVLRAEAQTLRAEFRTEITGSETSLRQEIRDTAEQLRAEIKDTETALRHEIKDTEHQLRAEIAHTETALRQEIHALAGEVAATNVAVRAMGEQVAEKIGAASTAARNWIITALLGSYAFATVVALAAG